MFFTSDFPLHISCNEKHVCFKKNIYRGHFSTFSLKNAKCLKKKFAIIFIYIFLLIFPDFNYLNTVFNYWISKILLLYSRLSSSNEEFVFKSWILLISLITKLYKDYKENIQNNLCLWVKMSAKLFFFFRNCGLI